MKDPYEEGYEEGSHSKPNKKKCPYRKDTEEYEEWFYGFEDAGKESNE